MTGTLSKRQKIVAAARELFLLQGYEKTTMEEIARAAPLSKATLYSEFSNKEEILLEICRTHIDQMNTSLADLVQSTELNCLGTLKSALLKLVEGIYGVCATLRSPEALAFESARLQTRLIDRTQRMPEIVGSLLEKAKQTGEIDVHIETSVATKVILSALTSYLPPYHRHFTTPSRPALDTLLFELSLLLDLMCDGLQAHQIRTEVKGDENCDK